MFKVDDVVLYGSEGVCRITEITDKNFGRGPEKYYVLKPVYKALSTVFVPAGNEALVSRMHSVLSRDEVNRFIDGLPNEKLPWIEDENERKAKYKEILDSGDRCGLACVIGTIFHRRKALQASGKKLHLCDERAFKDAEKMLYDEFAYVLNISPDDVPAYIRSRIGDA